MDQSMSVAGAWVRPEPEHLGAPAAQARQQAQRAARAARADARAAAAPGPLSTLPGAMAR
jgi:hypothetical protein